MFEGAISHDDSDSGMLAGNDDFDEDEDMAEERYWQSAEWNNNEEGRKSWAVGTADCSWTPFEVYENVGTE